ncbi:hypothetical protein LINGRAPRIM_LOCUS2712 [Linum grandiflorum]
MAKKVVDAILMDASVYAIIVVCALCGLGFELVLNNSSLFFLDSDMSKLFFVTLNIVVK